MTLEIQKLPTWFRVLQNVTGGIAIALSGFVLMLRELKKKIVKGKVK